MTTPKYTLTNLLLRYIVKYEVCINDLKYKQLPDQHKLPIQEKFGSEDIQNLGELVGNNIGYNQSLLIQRGQEMPTERKTLKLFVNVRNAKDFINSYNSNNSLKPSIELASHINKLVMSGLVDDWDLAKLRAFSEKPNEIYDTWYKYRDFYPHLEVHNHFNTLFDWIQNGNDTNHKLIKLGILLYEFIDKAPFLCGNQITAILMIEMLLKRYGYNPDNITPLFKSFEDISEDILSAFKLSKSKRDLTTFLEAYLYTLSLSIVEVTKNFKDTYESKVKKQGSLELHLNPRQIQLLEYLSINPKVTRNKYTKMMGVSFMTSYRDLQDMLEKKYIKLKGKGRGTYYVLVKNMVQKEEELI